MEWRRVSAVVIALLIVTSAISISLYLSEPGTHTSTSSGEMPGQLPTQWVKPLNQTFVIDSVTNANSVYLLGLNYTGALAYITAVSLTDGSTLWNRTIALPSDSFFPNLYLYGGNLVVASTAFYTSYLQVLELNSSSGKQVYTNTYHFSNFTISDISSQLIGNLLPLAGDYSNSYSVSPEVYAVSVSSNQTVWKYNASVTGTSGFSFVGVFGSNLLLLDYGPYVSTATFSYVGSYSFVYLNGSTGTPLWSTPDIPWITPGIITDQFLIDGNSVYFLTNQSRSIWLDELTLSNGIINQRFQLPGATLTYSSGFARNITDVMLSGGSSDLFILRYPDLASWTGSEPLGSDISCYSTQGRLLWNIGLPTSYPGLSFFTITGYFPSFFYESYTSVLTLDPSYSLIEGAYALPVTYDTSYLQVVVNTSTGHIQDTYNTTFPAHKSGVMSSYPAGTFGIVNHAEGRLLSLYGVIVTNGSGSAQDFYYLACTPISSIT